MGLMLYYDLTRKRLVKEDSFAGGPFIQEHNEKGKNAPLAKQELEIPESSVKIIVKTNLHYGAKSYMRASISMTNRTIFNFIDARLSHPVCNITANPEDWDSLFDGIISLYNNRLNSEVFINKYFDIIKDTLNDIKINENSIALVTRRLAEISRNLPDSIYYDNILIDNRIIEVCALLFRKIIIDKTKSIWDKKIRQEIESNLHDIFYYLSNRDEVLAVLEGINVQL